MMDSNAVAAAVADAVEYATAQLDAELGGLGRALVHLPVARDQHGASLSCTP